MALNLIATISLDGSQFKRGMQEVTRSAADGVRGLIIQAVGVAALTEAFRATVETANDLVNTSKRLNIPVEQLQVLRQAAQNTGVEFDRVAESMEKLNEAKINALGFGTEGGGGESKQMKAFYKLGISNQQLRSGDTQEIFKAIADKVKQTANPQDLIVPLRDIFGRAGGALIPMLQSDLGGLEKSMKDVGAIMSSETAAGLREFKNQTSELSKIMQTSLAPAFLWCGIAVLKMTDAALKFISWIDQKMGIGKAGAGLGAIAGQVGTWGLVKALFHPWNQKEYLNQLARQRGAAGFDFKAATSAMNSTNASDPFAAWSGMMQKALENSLSKIYGAKVELGSTTSGGTTQAGVSIIRRRIGEDSLARVGNFLGASGASLTTTAAQHAAIQTARNTQALVDISKTIAANTKPRQNGQADNAFRGRGAGGDWGSLHFPST